MNVEIVLTYLIHTRWVKNLSTSTLAFDITQSLVTSINLG